MTTTSAKDLSRLAKIAGIKALDAWNLKADKVELISQSENLVYQVDTLEGQRFALRVHRPGYHSIQALESEQTWTSALNKAGILVPIGQPKPDGSYYQPVPVLNSEDIRQIGLVAWLDGQSLHELVDQQQSKQQPEQAGSQLLFDYINKTGTIAGLIHNQSSNWQIPTNFIRHHLDAEGFMGDSPFWGPFWALPELSAEQTTLFSHVKQALYAYLDRLEKNQDNYSLIHADLHGGNLLVSAQDITVIDFDDAGFGWHPYELAVALFNFQDHPDFSHIYHQLIAGYLQVRSLEQNQLDQIPVFLLIRALAAIGWCHHRREIDQTEYLASLIQTATVKSQQFLTDQLVSNFNQSL
ncbi:MAG: Ser/Thr protein kinase RdoA (MazF antagonist) [Candidatus Azotimanducaceae bacterium]|jgi:Ser/Thr protein kinase RdoA (MazF antagonist)